MSTGKDDVVLLLLAGDTNHLEAPVLVLHHLVLHVAVVASELHRVGVWPGSAPLLDLVLQLTYLSFRIGYLLLEIIVLLGRFLVLALQKLLLFLESGHFFHGVLLLLFVLKHLLAHILAGGVIGSGLLLQLGDHLLLGCEFKALLSQLLLQELFFSCQLLELDVGLETEALMLHHLGLNLV